MYPDGHLGFVPVTFLVDFSLEQLIVKDFLIAGVGVTKIFDFADVVGLGEIVGFAVGVGVAKVLGFSDVVGFGEIVGFIVGVGDAPSKFPKFIVFVFA